MNSKGRNIVSNGVNNNIIERNEYYEAIGLCGFYYTLFE